MQFVARLLLTSTIGSSLAAGEIHSGWWRGRPVTYEVVEGLAVTQGDVQLGVPAEIPEERPGPENPKQKSASFVAYQDLLWPNGIVPYAIVSSASTALRQRIAEAIQIYQDNTPVRWIPRTNQANYVQFITLPADVNECGDSAIGMIGGQQLIRISQAEACLSRVGHVLHEMTHTVGKEHEQIRFDRDFYIRVHYENLNKLFFDQYDPRLGNTPFQFRAADVLPYDYGSIMHYPPTAGRRDTSLNTIDTIPLGIPISEGEGFSVNDIEAIRLVYGAAPRTATIVSSQPERLQVIVDGVRIVTAQTFAWAPGTRHTVDVPADPQLDSSNPDFRYVFARWSNDGPQSQTILASADNFILTASFSVQSRIQTSVAASGGGTVGVTPASPGGYHTVGSQVSIAAVPAAGFQFVRWDAPAGGLRSSAAGDSDNPVVFVVQDLNATGLAGGYFYRANFVRSTDPVTTIGTTTLSAKTPVVQAVIDGTTRRLPSSFSWTPGSTHTMEIADRTQPATSGAPSRYVFQGWSNGGGASHTILAPSSSATITAQWKRQFLVTARVGDPDNGPNTTRSGAVTLSPQASDCPSETSRGTGCYYDDGARVQFTPNAIGSYRFTGWSGDLGGATLPGVIQVNDQKVVTANFAVPGRLSDLGIVNAGNYGIAPLVPGEVIAIFGYQFGPGALTGAQVVNGGLSKVLSKARVLFDGIPAALVYVSANQIAAVVPYAVAGRDSTVMQIEYDGVRGNAVEISVGQTDPALFSLDSSGRGQAAALNENGTLNSPQNPAARRSVVVLFGTGDGSSTPAGVDGKLAKPPYPKPLLPVSVKIAGRNATVLYAGAAPDLVAGVFQINVLVPDDCPSGSMPVSVWVGDFASPANISIAVR